MPKKNPLKLNNLQLKTLTILQELGRHPQTSSADPNTGLVTISMIPQPHGDHVHVGPAVASKKDASGLWNENAWRALQRKGLLYSQYPIGVALTEEGQNYDTGLRHVILHGLPDDA